MSYSQHRRRALATGALHLEAKEAFAAHAAAPDATGVWRLKCTRETEACIYENRVALADALEDKFVDADVQVLFAEKRRGKPGEEEATLARDLREAERVVSRCRAGSIEKVAGVGHFLVLEDPDTIAAAIGRALGC